MDLTNGRFVFYRLVNPVPGPVLLDGIGGERGSVDFLQRCRVYARVGHGERAEGAMAWQGVVPAKEYKPLLGLG